MGVYTSLASASTLHSVLEFDRRACSGVAMSPSTEWKEVIAPDEGVVFERLAADLQTVQAAAARKMGSLHRGLHAKPNVSVRAQFEVLAGLPANLKVGLFAEPKQYDAVVRFSNGGPVRQGDKRPDVRGIAVKVFGVPGKKVIPGMEGCSTQDFLGILTSSQPFRTPEEFVWFVVNARKPLTLLPKAIAHLGLSRFFALAARLRKGLSAEVKPLHTNRYFSALPIRYGPYAAKYSFAPAEGQAAGAAFGGDLGAELANELAHRELRWELQMQFFSDERATPVEDPTVDWAGPWTPVARLTLPKQVIESEKGRELQSWAETLSFDPWHAIEELRPLGAMMRARNAAYRVSTQARKAASEPNQFPAGLR